jgi:hypothetical protein
VTHASAVSGDPESYLPENDAGRSGEFLNGQLALNLGLPHSLTLNGGDRGMPATWDGFGG